MPRSPCATRAASRAAARALGGVETVAAEPGAQRAHMGPKKNSRRYAKGFHQKYRCSFVASSSLLFVSPRLYPMDYLSIHASIPWSVVHVRIARPLSPCVRC